jgi:hypothetical protein
VGCRIAQGVGIEPPAADCLGQGSEVAVSAGLFERCVQVGVVASERARAGVRRERPGSLRACMRGVAAQAVRLGAQRSWSPPGRPG